VKAEVEPNSMGDDFGREAGSGGHDTLCVRQARRRRASSEAYRRYPLKLTTPVGLLGVGPLRVDMEHV
jgi:hypothetical protein